MKKPILKINSAHVLDMIKRYKTDETGSTAIEYGLISGLIGVLLITGAGALGQNIGDLFNGVSRAIEGNPFAPPPEIPLSNSTAD